MKIYTFYFKQCTTDVPKNYFVLSQTPIKSNLTIFLLFGYGYVGFIILHIIH